MRCTLRPTRYRSKGPLLVDGPDAPHREPFAGPPCTELVIHGSDGFSIRPPRSLLPGDDITNIANIYFDFNPPVITEPSVLVAEFSTGIAADVATNLVLAPVPASDHLRIISSTMVDMVTVLAMDGRPITQQSLRSTTATLDVSALISGTYIVLVSDSDGTVHRVPFIVIHL